MCIYVFGIYVIFFVYIYISIFICHTINLRKSLAVFCPFMFVSAVHDITTPTKNNSQGPASHGENLQDLRAQNLDGQVETQAVLWAFGVCINLGGGFKYFEVHLTPLCGRFKFRLILFKGVGSTTN